MKCIICEKDMIPESREDAELKKGESDICPPELQPSEGGEVSLHFGFGSRYDWLGCRDPIRGGPIITGSIGGKKIKFQNPVGSKPSENALKHEKRAVQLAACSGIKGVICDDCFEKKSQLFRGYEEKKDENGKERQELLIP